MIAVGTDMSSYEDKSHEDIVVNTVFFLLGAFLCFGGIALLCLL